MVHTANQRSSHKLNRADFAALSHNSVASVTLHPSTKHRHDNVPHRSGNDAAAQRRNSQTVVCRLFACVVLRVVCVLVESTVANTRTESTTHDLTTD